MANRLTIHPDVEREIEVICSWYEQQASGIGPAFVVELTNLISAILRHPEMYPSFEEGYRRALLRRFPYQVLYYLDTNHVLIVSVVHQHMEPSGVSTTADSRKQ